MIVIDSGSRARRRLLSFASLAASVVAMMAAACGGPSGGGQTSMGTGGSSSSSVGGASSVTTSVTSTSAASSSSGEGGGSSAMLGLPCDLLDALQTRCTSCHGNPTKFKAPMALLTYADLTAMSEVDETQTFAERCVARMQDAAKPMPPGAGVSMTAAQIAAFTTWIQAGYPEGDCMP